MGKCVISNDQLQTDLLNFLEQNKTGEKYSDLINKVDKNMSIVSEEMHVIRNSMVDTVNKVETFTSRKFHINSLIKNKQVHLAQEQIIKICNTFYNKLLVDLLDIDKDKMDENSFKNVYDVVKDETLQKIQVATMDYEPFIKDIVEQAIHNCWTKCQEYSEQALDIFMYSINGNRNRLLTKHINTVKYMSKSFFTKEFWKIAKEKLQIV